MPLNKKQNKILGNFLFFFVFLRIFFLENYNFLLKLQEQL